MAEPTIYETHFPHPDSGARIAELESEIERLRLTDSELEAISEAVLAFDEFAGDEVYVRTLRGLLKRLK